MHGGTGYSVPFYAPFCRDCDFVLMAAVTGIEDPDVGFDDEEEGATGRLNIDGATTRIKERGKAVVWRHERSIKNKDVNMLIIPNRTQKGGTKMGSVDVVKYFRCTNWNRKDKPCHFRQRVVVLRSEMDIPGEKLA